MTSFHWKPNRNDNITRKDLLFLFLGVLFVGSILSYFEYQRNTELESSKITSGVIIKENRYRNHHYIYAKYFIDGKKIESSRIPIEKCGNELRIGDTVILKYSKLNHETAQLLECYWNDNLKKKYGFYNWQD